MNIYIETSIFNRYFDVDTIFHQQTVQLFNEIKAGKFTHSTLVYVIDELKAIQGETNKNILRLIQLLSIKVLPKNKIVDDMADLYIQMI
jgi:hypothetical protein